MHSTLPFLLRLVLLSWLGLSASLLSAQPLQWLNGASGSGNTRQEAVILLPNGEALVAGYGSSGPKQFPPLSVNVSPSGSSSFHIGKTDGNGQYLWVDAVLDSATKQVRMAQFSSSSVMIAAQIEGEAFYLNGAADTMPSGYESGTLLAKYDINSGVADWMTLLPGTVSLGDIATDNGMIYLTGSYINNFSVGSTALPDAPSNSPFSGITNGYLAQFDSIGQPVWATHMASQVNLAVTNFGFVEPSALVADGDTIYVAGNHQDAMQIGGFFLPNSTGGAFDSTDIFVAGFTSLGSPTWAQSSVGSSYQQVFDMTLTGDGGLLLAGINSSAFTFNGGTVDGVGVNGPLYFGGYALKLSKVGMYQWSFSTTAGLYSVAADEQNQLFVGGDFRGNTGTLSLADSVLIVPAGIHPVVAKVSTLGELDWVSYGLAGSAPNGFPWQAVSALSVDNDGHLAAAGSFGQTLDWDGLSLSGTGRDHYALVMDDSSWILPPPPPFPADSIWPGDANYDLVANNFDILSIGLSFGSTGPVRAGASTNWVAQPGYDWTGSLPSGANYKHSDTDGDGVVTFDDTLAVTLNYGQVHLRPADVRSNGPLLYPEFLEDSLSVGDTAHIAIQLGNDTLLASNIYGVAFTLTLDTSLVDLSSLQIGYDNSWLGTKNTDLITLSQSSANGQLDMALSRIDQQNITGKGAIAHLMIIMVDDLTAKTDLSEVLRLEVSNVLVLDALGEVVEVSLGADSMVLTQEVTTGLLAMEEGGVSLYPQPAQGRLQVQLDGMTATRWDLLDLTGRQLHTEIRRFQATTLSLPNLSSGVYLLQLHTDRGLIRRQVLLRQP
jgi:hypothetical protein